MLDLEIPIPNRLQDRRNDVAFAPASGFANAADTDPSLAGNRAWGYEIIGRAGTSDIGLDLVANQTISSEANLQEVMDRVVAGGACWANESLQTRATKLHEIGVAMEANRGRLIEVAMAEAGKTIEQADTEISEAVDFAHYYAQRALELDKIDGASPVPFGVTVVTPPWNFPIAIPAGGALAALATGSAVIFKPAGASARCGAFIAYSGSHQSIHQRAQIRDRAIIVSSFGKTFHITGWKLGYLICPSELMKEIHKVHQFLVFSVNSVAQHALALYLERVDVASLSTFYREKRDLFRLGMANSRFELLPSQGSYFQVASYANISTEPDTDFCIRLAKEFGVAAIPLSVFNANGEDRHLIRFCYAKTDATLQAAIEKLCKI